MAAPNDQQERRMQRMFRRMEREELNVQENRFRSYSRNTRDQMKKFHLKYYCTRDEMAKECEFDEVSQEWRSLQYMLLHTPNCRKPRCTATFCMSMKPVLRHYAKCVHLDCNECNRLNRLIYEHCTICDDPRVCNVPGCLAIARVNGKLKEREEEPCYSKDCEDWAPEKKPEAPKAQEDPQPGSSRGPEEPGTSESPVSPDEQDVVIDEGEGEVHIV
ncbi:hypothetical protein CAEBREN_13240 [Caenorhabditis brenneri]|uniref:TAZ-type domain-containing protein n=1 Tax=Caenorhabditis brenneri TaxID=135651 RepID=G0P7M0_CAEBE|nr:hypothetical protein CAEBREN_13240 [Caenorhabditis brenneri]